MVLADLDPRAIPLPDVTAVFSLFAEVRRLAGNGETLMAGRVKDARQWAAEGHPSVEDWIAKQTGSTVSAAKGQVTTSERLDQLPNTAEKMRAGEVSSEQAGIVADQEENAAGDLLGLVEPPVALPAPVQGNGHDRVGRHRQDRCPAGQQPAEAQGHMDLPAELGGGHQPVHPYRHGGHQPGQRRAASALSTCRWACPPPARTRRFIPRLPSAEPPPPRPRLRAR